MKDKSQIKTGKPVYHFIAYAAMACFFILSVSRKHTVT